ncbi:hypothetical protein K0A97_02435 [Patescibacteria group bacterium]|nr:hypothetical protein [Patescibacteria group bacterium]
MMYKHGGKLISVYWFFIIFIVAAGIIYMVLSFYNKPYDVRNMEVELLIVKISDCLSYGGYLNDSLINSGGHFSEEFKENFEKICSLNFSVEDFSNWKENDQFYLKIDLFNFDIIGEKIDSFEQGDRGLTTFCDLEGEYLPVCSKRSFYALDKNNTKYQIEILSIIKKTEKNA